MNTQIGGSHYKNYRIQPLDWALDNSINAAEFSILRYVLRYRDKNGLEDLDKAIHYAQILVRRDCIVINKDAKECVDWFCNKNSLNGHQSAVLNALFDNDYVEVIAVLRMMRSEYEQC